MAKIVTSTRRIFTNTLALYVRMALTAGLALFGSRWVLAGLGVVDYGLFCVIAGIMGFMGFLNAAMAVSSQRHLAFELGRGDFIRLNKVFNTCLGIHLCLAILLILLGETVGLYFLKEVLKIPEARRAAAFWVYQLTIVSTVANVVSVPYQAVLTSRESLVWLSAIGIIQGVLTFFLALLISSLPGDILIGYAAIYALIISLMPTIHVLLCRLKFPESRLNTRYLWNPPLAREIASFSAWNLFGIFGTIARSQGLAFLLNVFFGPAINAAYGLANQVAGQVSQFTDALLQAVTPQIVKNEGMGDRTRMLSFSLQTSKYAFMLASLWMLPLLSEMPTIIDLWLKEVPPHTGSFCRLVLIIFSFDKLTIGFLSAVQAIGRIAAYQATLGSLLIVTLPAGYLLLKIGAPPESVLWGAFFFAVLSNIGRIWFIRRLTGQPVSVWFNQVFMRCMLAILPSVTLCSIFLCLLPPSLFRLAFIFTSVPLFMIAGAWFFGMTGVERRYVLDAFMPSGVSKPT